MLLMQYHKYWEYNFNTHNNFGGLAIIHFIFQMEAEPREETWLVIFIHSIHQQWQSASCVVYIIQGLGKALNLEASF